MELTPRVVRCCSLLVLSLLLATPLAAQFTGTWSGIYQDQWNCGTNGGTFTSTGPLLLVLTQSGNQVTGTATIDFSADDCKMLTSPKRVTGPVEGTVSGKTFNGSILGHGASSAAILTLSADDGTLGVQYKISQSPPTVYFLTANLIRGPSAPTAAVTGSWSGTASYTTRCQNGVVRSGSDYAFALALMEQNGAVTGVATIEVDLLNVACALEKRQTFRLPLTGTVAGNTLTATVLIPLSNGDDLVAMSATVSGPTMSLAFTGQEGTGSVTLTQTSTTTPDSRFGGVWNGNYVINQGSEQGCPVMPIFSGPISATFFHAGTEISGFMTLFDTKHFDGALSCRLHEHYDFTVFLSGSVSGNTATGPGAVVWANEGVGEDSKPLPVTLTLSGNTITASVGDEGFATFTLSRSSTALPPIITSFEVGQPLITTGQSSTLRWDTFNATSVTIDNGLGPQGTSGSVTIAPLVTTTYTLTATASGGTVTAKTTVTVLGGVSRRRAVRHNSLREPTEKSRVSLASTEPVSARRWYGRAGLSFPRSGWQIGPASAVQTNFPHQAVYRALLLRIVADVLLVIN
jgi:hypothetical protein